MRRMTFSDVKKFVSNWRKELVVIGVVLGGLGVVALILCLPQWQAEHVKEYPYELAKLTDEYRRTLVQGLGGFFLLVGLYWTSRRVLAAEDNVRVAQDNVRVAEEGHITERFTKAIEQLGQKGPDNMAIRLGGIYALERIAKNSEEDHGPIMEVLTAYVREKATKQGKYAEEAAVKPTTDIQAILTVIGRRETIGINRRDARLDLSNTHLAGVVLNGRARLSRADLIQANLSQANLIAANLITANLSQAELHGADLREANLSRATNLTAEQVLSAKNWHKAYLPDSLKYLLTEPSA